MLMLLTTLTFTYVLIVEWCSCQNESAQIAHSNIRPIVLEIQYIYLNWGRLIGTEFVLHSFDNSDYQRNGDYFPTRLNVQKDGINLIGMSKIRANPENNVGFLTYARWVWAMRCGICMCNWWQMFVLFSTVEVMSTLTTDVGRILSKMHAVQPKGDINFLTGVRIAHVSSSGEWTMANAFLLLFHFVSGLRWITGMSLLKFPAGAQTSSE